MLSMLFTSGGFTYSLILKLVYREFPIAGKLMGKVDPVTLEVVKNALTAICEEMGVSLQKSSYSTNIKTRLDFSCAIFDHKQRWIVQASHQPAHLASMYIMVRRVLADYGVENLGEGDLLLINDPHEGGTHIPDIFAISPIYFQSDLYAYAVNIAHHSDLGGKTPGSCPGDSTEIFQEGLIIPPIKIVEKGIVNRDLLKLILANVRTPEERAGDLRAQIAANRLGSRRTIELIEKYGAETLFECMEELLDYSERRMRSEISKFPSGVYEAEDHLDSGGVTDDPVKVAVRITIQGGEATVDLSGSDKQIGNVNSTLAQTYSGVAFPFVCLTDPEIPLNDGFYRPIKVVAPEGLVINAKYPASTAGGWETATRVVDVIFRALSEALKDRVPAASKGSILNLSYGGIDPRNGKVYAFYETIAGGFGARPTKDGMDGVQPHLQNTQNAPIEEFEINCPVLVEQLKLIEDSEGAGCFRGGLGIRKDIRFCDHSATFSVLAERGKFAPWGLFGGLGARTARFIVNPDSERRVDLPSKAVYGLRPGDVVSIQTPGGGGYGDPFLRDPRAVLHDVCEGKISLERARNVYGVVIDPERLKVDDHATTNLRSRRQL